MKYTTSSLADIANTLHDMALRDVTFNGNPVQIVDRSGLVHRRNALLEISAALRQTELHLSLFEAIEQVHKAPFPETHKHDEFTYKLWDMCSHWLKREKRTEEFIEGLGAAIDAKTTK